jgi:hypothetical protein
MVGYRKGDHIDDNEVGWQHYYTLMLGRKQDHCTSSAEVVAASATFDLLLSQT